MAGFLKSAAGQAPRGLLCQGVLPVPGYRDLLLEVFPVGLPAGFPGFTGLRGLLGLLGFRGLLGLLGLLGFCGLLGLYLPPLPFPLPLSFFFFFFLE